MWIIEVRAMLSVFPGKVVLQVFNRPGHYSRARSARFWR